MPTRNPTRSVPRAGLVLAALALAACGDRGQPLAPAPPPEPGATVAQIRCTARVKAGSVSCAPTSGLSDARALVVGGQGTYVQLTSGEPAYLSGDNVFVFDVNIQNLLPQAMGTADGTTPSAGGVRIFFHQQPTVTAGTGEIDILNEDGSATYTAAEQPYYEYAGETLGADGILSPGETSGDKTWELSVEPTVETFEFLLFVAADVPFPGGYVDVTPAADTLLEGGAQALSATVRTAVGLPIAGETVAWATSDPAVATVDASGNVTAVGPGTATITATAGARSGGATVTVCADVAAGEVYAAEMPAGSSFCLGGGAAGAEYVVVPVNTGASPVSLSLTGAGIVPVSGTPTPDLLPGGRARLSARFTRTDGAFEARLRRMERRELAGRMAQARVARGRSAARGARFAITPGVPAVGALMSLNVETDDACSTSDVRTGRVVAVGTRVIVIADTTNPAGGLTAADYQAIADSFDAVIHPAVTAGFDNPATPAEEGSPADMDGNGRVIAFYTRAVNELTPPGSSSYVGGFFYSRDLFPADACPTSNVGEMFYMLAADPSGEVNGNVRGADLVREATLGTLAHEYQHMINASRRLYVNPAIVFEETWLDEGLSHVAEEMVFYAASGLAPGADVDLGDVADGGQVEAAFFKYAEPNFARLREWLLSPSASGLFQADDDLATRGAAWAFLRYAADRQGGSAEAFFSALLNGTTSGMGHLGGVIGTSPLPWVRDFTAAVYADNAAIGAAAPYTMPSWNFRDLYANLDYEPGPACSCAYELAVRDPSSGVADAFALDDGGAAAYTRMGVAADAFAGVTILSGGVAPESDVRLVVIRRK